MRILIVYASRYGQTERVAERMAAVARRSGAEVHLYEVGALPSNLTVRLCDVVVVAGAVYFGRHSKKLERFATVHRTDMARLKSVFVSVSGASRTPQGREVAEAAAHDFCGRTGWAPDRVELVAGAEPFTRYGFFTRWFMVRHAKKLGRTVDPRQDYEYTDWSAVDRLAEEIVGASVRAELVTA